jgi:hypothetical protein
MFSRASKLLSSLPSHITVDSIAIGRVDGRGARLSLPQYGVHVHVPEGAIDAHYAQEMYLAVVQDAMQRPTLKDGRRLLALKPNRIITQICPHSCRPLFGSVRHRFNYASR